jgi:hypothetical protein
MSRNYDATLVKRAHLVWETMHDEVKKRGLALTKEKIRGTTLDGRVFIGTIGAFISALNNEREWGYQKHECDLVRQYLKDSGNVVTLSKVEQYRFRIFIREEWGNGLLITLPKATAKKTSGSKSHDPEGKKLRPEEVGEDRPPAPVEYKCADCGKTFEGANARMALMGHRASHSPRTKKEKKRTSLSSRQSNLLKVLEQLGGEITDPDGNCTSKWATAAGETDPRYVSASQLSFKKRGLLIREGKEKKTYRFALTKKGLAEAKKLPEVPLHTETPPKPPMEQKTVFYDPDKTKPSEAPPGPEHLPITGNQNIDTALSSLVVRIAGELHFARKSGNQQEKLDLIASLVKEVNEGKLSPLKALGDIEAALDL